MSCRWRCWDCPNRGDRCWPGAWPSVPTTGSPRWRTGARPCWRRWGRRRSAATAATAAAAAGVSRPCRSRRAPPARTRGWPRSSPPTRPVLRAGGAGRPAGGPAPGPGGAGGGRAVGQREVVAAAGGSAPGPAGGALPGKGPVGVVLLTPGAHPLAVLQARLAAAVDGQSTMPDLGALRFDPTLARYSLRSPAVIVVDQLEELFTACPDRGEREAFLEALEALAGEDPPMARIVLGVRADFYGECAVTRGWPPSSTTTTCSSAPWAGRSCAAPSRAPPGGSGCGWRTAWPSASSTTPAMTRRPAARRPRPGGDVGPAPGHRARPSRGTRPRAAWPAPSGGPPTSCGSGSTPRPGGGPPPPPPARPPR